MTNQSKIKALIFYLPVFYGFWAIGELFLFEQIRLLLNNEVLSQLVINALIKNLVWTLPAVIMIYHFKDDVYVTLKDIFSSKVNWLKYVPIFLLFTIFLIGDAIMVNGKLAISSEFGFDDVIDLLFVGVTEEMVFRGWLLNVTIKEDKKWRYIIINALMFLAIHFPIWIHNGIFVSSFTGFGFLCVIILSVIFSYTFIKSKNILVPIALHTYWDLLMFMFF